MTATDLRAAPQKFKLQDNSFQLEKLEVPMMLTGRMMSRQAMLLPENTLTCCCNEDPWVALKCHAYPSLACSLGRASLAHHGKGHRAVS